MSIFFNKRIKVAFYFEKKKILDKDILCNNNKLKSRSIFELCQIIFEKTYILLCIIVVKKDKKYTNYTKNIVYNKVFNEFNIFWI